MTRRLRLAVSTSWARAASGRLSQTLFRYAEFVQSRPCAWPGVRYKSVESQPSTGALPTVRVTAGGELGQALAEEALLLVLVGIVAVGALVALQGSISDTLGSVAGSLGWLAPDEARSGK